MSYLAQNGTALLYICHVAVLSLLLLTGCTDANPEKSGTPTDAQLTDSSITSFNALVRHAPVPESDALSGGETTVFDSTEGAFEHAAPNLSAGELEIHDAGDETFAGHLAGGPSVSNQVIHPYTDLLVHDMGEGLADNRPDFTANGREFRTAPLWGVGLTTTVNANVSFLHDGRARTLTEAILWHGGEAERSREIFR